MLDPHHRATIGQQSVSKPSVKDDLSSDPMAMVNASIWISQKKMQDTCQTVTGSCNVENFLLRIHGTSIYKDCLVSFAEAKSGGVQG
jgi:hypothetical protein